ncbi:isoaspartyl peptidase/L-asparaginase-like [Antedon mediterranea]|uniref:isoaspartyl peptidase/L-asparaginase-like n=1 Tax=Antedon mediterranea TaxID=105859 RepID=UPI003AF98DF4
MTETCTKKCKRIQPTVLVHGGAWTIPDSVSKPYVNGVQEAVKKGYEVLCRNESAVDAVEEAVRYLENDPTFNAGTGSALNIEGDVEMDAIIMEGKNLQSGAVTCVQNIKNPVSLARLVMEKTDHTLLAAKGANQFATEQGIEQVNTDELVCEKSLEMSRKYNKYSVTVSDQFRQGKCHDTVGAVAVDASGNVACATSTGGITGKRVGRVGDSPLIGCGAYCDNNFGAVSSTGHGESISRVTLCRTIIAHMEQGLSPQDAAEKALSYMTTKVQGSGGVIVVSNQGDIGMSFTTIRMAWASMQDGRVCYGLDPGQKIEANKG